VILEIKVNKKFLKELATLPNKTRQKVEKLVFDEPPSIENLNEIPNIPKSQGAKLTNLPDL